MYSLSYIVSKLLRKILNPPAINHSRIDKTAKVDIGCSVSYSIMGRYSYIGEYTSLSKVKVGSFTSISSGCAIGGGSHPMHWVSTSPIFNSSRSILRKNFSKNNFNTHEDTLIGNDVWIGSNCLIKSGIKIGDGAVIGMGSVVTHDVGPYEVWCGNPARCIKKRFDDKTIELLIEKKWWDWEEKKLIKIADRFNDMKSFMEA